MVRSISESQASRSLKPFVATRSRSKSGDPGRLSDAHLSQLLFSLAMADADADHQVRLACVIAVQYAEGREARAAADPSADVDVAWALCALGLAGRYRGLLGGILLRTLGGEVPRSLPPLLKLSDVVFLADLRGAGVRAKVTDEWRAALEEAARRESQRLGSAAAAIHDEVAACLDGLGGGSGADAWPALALQRGRWVGPCPVDLLDEAGRAASPRRVARRSPPKGASGRLGASDPRGFSSLRGESPPETKGESPDLWACLLFPVRGHGARLISNSYI